MRDPNVDPTADALSAGLGTAYAAFAKFTEALQDHSIQIDYGSGSA